MPTKPHTSLGAARVPDPPNQLLTTVEVAQLVRCSTAWLELLRSRGKGPPYLKLSARRFRYKVGDVEAWLAQFTDQSAKRKGGAASK